MRHIEVRRRFRSAPEQVFGAYVDRSGWADGGAGRVGPEGAEVPDCVGAVRVVGGRGLALHEQLLELAPPKRLAYAVVRGAAGFRKHRGEVFFEPDGDGTLVRWTVRLEPTLPGAGPLIELATTRILRTSLEKLAASVA